MFDREQELYGLWIFTDGEFYNICSSSYSLYFYKCLRNYLLFCLVYFSVNDGQTPAPQYRGLRNAVATIFQQEGARGLYRGVTPNIWGSGSAWGFYFLLYVPLITFIECFLENYTK
jgi:hypothetical protein